jgi:hypothetical protein
MEVSGQLHTLGAFTPGERASGIHWIGGWVGPRAGLDDVEKRKSLQAVARRYADWAISAHFCGDNMAKTSHAVR